MSPKLSTYGIISVLLMAAVPAPLRADEIRLIPGLVIKEEYNDNIFMAVNPEDDFVTTVSPSLSISRSNERGSIGLTTGINALIFAHHHDQNSVDFYANGLFNYKYDSRLSLSGGAGYVQDSRRDQVDLNGVVAKSGSDRQDYRVSGAYVVSEKSTSQVSYAYALTLYDNPRDGSSKSHTINFNQDYDLEKYLQQTKMFGNFRCFRSINDTSHADNYALTVGLTRKINELWDVSANSGGSYTHTESDINNPLLSTFQDDDLGWIANLSLNYNGEKTSGSLSFSHDVVPSSNGGRGGAAMTRTGVSVNVREKMSRDFSGSLDFGYSNNKSLQNLPLSQSTNEDNLRCGLGLRYELSKYAALEGSYLFNYVYYNNTSSDAAQNVFSLRLTIQRDIMDLL